MPEISIIVPIYNVEAFLPQCLASIAAQTFRDFECILVNDGSPDGSGALCDEQARRDPRFRVIHQENGGLSAARNSGMKLAQGRYLIFCDGDDALHPRLLELALAAQELHPQDLVVWRFTSDLGDWGTEFPAPVCLPITRFSQSQMLRYFSDRQLFNSACNKLFPRAFLQAHQVWFDVQAYGIEDYVFFNAFRHPFFSEAVQAGICQLELPLYYYNQTNSGSITHTSGTDETGDFTGYCAQQLRLYAEIKAEFEPFFGYPPQDIALVMSATLQSLAYGLVHLPDPRRELQNLWRSAELPELLQWHRQQGLHNLFLTFLCLRWVGGLRRWLHICEHRPALYYTIYWLGYRRLRKYQQ